MLQLSHPMWGFSHEKYIFRLVYGRKKKHQQSQLEHTRFIFMLSKITPTQVPTLGHPIAQFDPDQVWAHSLVFLKLTRTPKMEFMPALCGLLPAARQQRVPGLA